MDHVEYVHTVGMSESEIDDSLRSAEHGVLGLADENDAYVIPLSYHYDGDRFLIRVSTHAQDSEKEHFLETTRIATFLCFEASTTDSWSIHVRGPVRKWEKQVPESTLNEWFPPFRLFGEAVESVEFSLYELEMETVVGRTTVE